MRLEHIHLDSADDQSTGKFHKAVRGVGQGHSETQACVGHLDTGDTHPAGYAESNLTDDLKADMRGSASLAKAAKTASLAGTLTDVSVPASLLLLKDMESYKVCARACCCCLPRKQLSAIDV